MRPGRSAAVETALPRSAFRCKSRRTPSSSRMTRDRESQSEDSRCPQSALPPPTRSPPTAPSARSTARPSPPGAVGRTARAGSSSCTSTPRAGCTSTCGWRWTACSARGPCPRDRRTTPPTSGSPCHVEDHPLEYGDFEGIIPEGNYGAGAVIVWDRGEWVPLEDPAEGLAKGKLLFELQGYKLHGLWTLVKIKKGEKEWLLIKERDAWASAERVPPAESVLSGLTVEELKAGQDRGAAIRARARTARRAAPDGRGQDRWSSCSPRPPSARSPGPGWLFELKLDGYRVLAARQGGEARLLTRNGNDYTDAFPEIARAVAALPFDRRAARRRGRRARRPGRAELPAAAEPGAAQPAARHPARGGRVPGHLLRLRPARLRGLRSAAAAAHGAQGAAPASAAAGRRAPLPRSRRGGGRGAVPRGRAARARGHRRARRPTRRTRRDARPCGSRSGRGRPETSWWSGSRRPRGRAAGSARCTSASTWTGR